MNNSELKFASGLLLFMVWGGLVILGKAPASGLVEAIQITLAGLGIYHVTGSNGPKGQ